MPDLAKKQKNKNKTKTTTKKNPQKPAVGAEDNRLFGRDGLTLKHQAQMRIKIINPLHF